MDWKELVGKWVLIRRIGSSDILEVIVLGVSPSGRYAKIRVGWTGEKWIDTKDYEVLEVLS